MTRIERYSMNNNAVDNIPLMKPKPVAWVKFSSRIIRKSSDHFQLMAPVHQSLRKWHAFGHWFRLEPLRQIKNAHASSVLLPHDAVHVVGIAVNDAQHLICHVGCAVIRDEAKTAVSAPWL